MENTPKQTAVDYLFLRMEVLRGLFLFEEIDYKEYVDQKKDVFEKAKEMEKQQIIDAYYIGNHCEFQGGSIVKEMGKRYYLKQYEKTTNN